jgi:hypothetical protein
MEPIDISSVAPHVKRIDEIREKARVCPVNTPPLDMIDATFVRIDRKSSEKGI